LRHGPAIESLGLARRGDAAKLRALLRHAPEVLASAPHAATLLHLAALAGRAAVVELLLRSGVDVNKPSPIETLIFVTPLCAARAKRRKEIELLLVRHGGKEDIFTHAFLGDLGRLQEDLVREPSSSQTVDPAVDALEITPIHHTVAGARVDALRALLLHTSQTKAPLLGGARERRDGRDAARAWSRRDARWRRALGSPSRARADARARWSLRRPIGIVDWALMHGKSRPKR
jgi:hypothetical protein